MITVQSPATIDYPGHPHALPPLDERSGRYTLRFARNRDELDRITRLRFEVFNLEIGEGLTRSWERCRDEDAYDASCHHLMVVETASARVVGTYRMQTCEMARQGAGFYSDVEFDLRPLQGILADAVELGRACIAHGHRNQRVLYLLWRGLAVYVMHNAKRYFFGCCSITGQDAGLAWRIHDHLRAQGQLHPTLSVPPRAAHACPRPAPAPGAAEAPAPPPTPPRLMQLYLDYGATVVSEPAMDAGFNTIDFLALFDVAGLDARVRRMFFD